MSMTPNDEILSIIRFAPGPIGAAGIYEQCKGIENINDVSSRLSQLFQQGKVMRHEIVTPNNRKGFAYTLPKPEHAAAPAPAPEAVRQEGSESAPAAPITGIRPASPTQAATEPAAKKPVRKLKAKPAPAAALPAASAPAPDSVAAAATLADAIIARLKRELAPVPSELEAAAGLGGLSVNIHIEQVDIHLGGL